MLAQCVKLTPLTRSCSSNPNSWWWNEIDALNQYGRLQGAATFVREALAGRLLSYKWSTYNTHEVSPGCAGSNAGWSIGRDDAGAVRAVSFFVYNKNHTWAAQNKSAELNPIVGCTTTLSGLALPAAPSVTWYNTTTGAPLSGVHASAAGDLVFDAPAFTTDAAALALME